MSRFLYFSNLNQDVPINLRIEKFIDSLRSNSEAADWQVNQARVAIKVYMNQFLGADSSILYGNEKKSPLRLAVTCHTASPCPIGSLWEETKREGVKTIKNIIVKLREAIRVKHYSYSTERSYIDWVKRFYEYLLDIKKKEVIDRDLTGEDVRDYLTYLAIKRRVASSTQNQAFNALLFLFREILKIDLKSMANTVRAKRGPKLPVVLSKEEMQEIFKRAKGRDLLVIQLFYGTGARLMEVARLRVHDIDFDGGMIFVRGSKQDKDRTTILPLLVKESLREHLTKVKSIYEEDLKKGFGEVYLPNALEKKYLNAAKEWGWQYVFPAANLSVDPRSGKVRRHHINQTTIQKMVKRIVKEAGIIKNASVHTLRHSFATHLLMDGINIREIQELLGHKNVETTMIYTHVLRDMSNAPVSPLDKLYESNM